MNANHHPTLYLLKDYASGNISDQLAVLISAHLESCDHCQSNVKRFEQEMAEKLASQQTNNNIPDFGHMLETILDKKQEYPDIINTKQIDKTLTYNDKRFELPTSLTHLKKYMSPWKNKLNSFHYSKINLNGPGNMYLIYFEKGAKIPQHTHNGNEFVYVIAGSFEDGVNEYYTGTFASFDHTHSHAPQTNDPDGCLLVTIIEAPFHFQKGHDLKNQSK